MDCDSVTQSQGTCEGREKNSNDERLHLVRVHYVSDTLYGISCPQRTPLKWALYSYFIEEETEVQSSVPQVQ